MKRLIVLICVLGGLLSSGLALGAGEFSWPMLVAPTAGSDKVQNRIKTESLDGCWAFNYTIASYWTTSFCLDKSTIAEYEPDVFFIDGLDEYSNIAVGGYWPEGNFYNVMITGPIFWEFFTFDFISPSTVSGCYYQVDPDTGSLLSGCYAMDGGRTSKTATEKAALPNKEHRNLLKQIEIDELPEDRAKSIVDKNILDGLNTLKATIDKNGSPANK